MRESTFDTWALIELFGHSRIAGLVTEQALGGSALIRVDVPALPARGDIQAQPAFTRYFGIAAIYSLTPVSEDLATAAADSMRVHPVEIYMATPQLRAGLEWDDDTDNNPDNNLLSFGPFDAAIEWDEEAHPNLSRRSHQHQRRYYFPGRNKSRNTPGHER